MKKYFIFFILISTVLTSFYYGEAATMTTTGFIPGQIWYSKDSFIEGDTVKIYTAIWNNGTSPLSAKVEFYDKNVVLGFRDILVPSSSLRETSISWKVTSGDHSISAKIISPSITTGGKKEEIIVTNMITEVDKRFVPVVVNTIEGKPATTSDVIKSQIDKATVSVDGILPDSISGPISENVSIVDSFRNDTFEKISESKIAVEKKIKDLKEIEDLRIISESSDGIPEKNITEKDKVGIETATEKPIAYLKLIFLSILSIIFGSKIIFYILIIFILFLVFRGIYRKIRNR